MGRGRSGLGLSSMDCVTVILAMCSEKKMGTMGRIGSRQFWLRCLPDTERQRRYVTGGNTEGVSGKGRELYTVYFNFLDPCFQLCV